MNIPEPLPTSDDYFDLAGFGRTVTTSSSEAQIWFDRGLTWTYCFNHEEACICFRQVIAHDPRCAMGYWGLAFALGPNYNKTWGVFDRDDLKRTQSGCYRIAQLAHEKALTTSSRVERALIEALLHRYPGQSIADFADANKAYADAMRHVYNDYGHGDMDVATLFVDALMSWKPRQMYSPQDGSPIPTSPVFEVKRILESCLARQGAKSHPGPPHLYVHLMEMSATPEAALPAADTLRKLIPDAGHMAHMPSHIDFLVGEYGHAIEANHRATLADDKYFALRGGVNFYSYYRLHDYHSLVYGAMLAGRPTLAFQTLDRMEATITEEMLRHRSPPMANWLEFFLAVRVHALIRFGRWDELKALPVPADRDLYSVTTAMRHYGKTIAHAATGDVDAAEQERLWFVLAATRVPESRIDYPNRIVDILRVAQHMLDGELEYRRGNHNVAFVHLREAIAHEDGLKYTEPWGWMLPARHAYGALSLERGLVEQAAQAYAEDLGIRKALTRAHAHPKNVWALHGYHECLVRLQRGVEEVSEIRALLEKAQAEAEIQIGSSCFCRLGEKGGCC